MKFSKPIRFQRKRPLKPSEFLRVYAAMRKAFGHQHWWPGKTPFEVMVGAILTQNTAWTNVEKAITNLRKEKKLSLKALRGISKPALARLIRPAGFFNIKTDRLKHFIAFLDREYQGSLRLMKKGAVAVLRERLLKVNGIGPETADSILLYALEKKSFVIDAYTKRIFSRHGLAGEGDSYAQWQRIFTQALPADLDLYNDYHAQIVRTAKSHCRKIPRCEACPLQPFLDR